MSVALIGIIETAGLCPSLVGDDAFIVCRLRLSLGICPEVLEDVADRPSSIIPLRDAISNALGADIVTSSVVRVYVRNGLVSRRPALCEESIIDVNAVRGSHQITIRLRT